MELTGKITAKIHAGTFDGVPEDTEVMIFIPGVKKSLKATLSDIVIEQAAALPINILSVTFNDGIWSVSPGTKSLTSVNGAEAVDMLQKAIPGMSSISTSCPACWDELGPPSGSPEDWRRPNIALYNVIIHLNDTHHWSREAVADWLDSKEWDLQFATPEETA